MKKIVLLIASGLTLSACVTAANFAPMTVPQNRLDAGLSSVRLKLRDPDAAQFRNIRTYQSDSQAGGGIILCGLVNGKNAFGGFTGFKPFRASLTPQGALSTFYIQGEGDLGTIAATAAPCNGASG